MGRILRRRESAQEDSENLPQERKATKKKQKTTKLKGVTKENKSPGLSKKSPIVKSTKRMALVDKTNRSSPPRDSKLSKEPLGSIGSSNLDKLSISAKIVEGKQGNYSKTYSPAVSTKASEDDSGCLRENRPPKYRASPIERPVTRSKIQTNNEKNATQRTGTIKKKSLKRKVDDGGENRKTTAGTEVKELQTVVETPITVPSIRPEKGSVLEKVSFENKSSLTQPHNDKATNSVLESKISNKQANLPNTSKARPIRKRKQADVKKEEQAEVFNEKEVLTEAGPVGVLPTNFCAYCRGVSGTCTCVGETETPLPGTKSGLSSEINKTHNQLENLTESSRKNDCPQLEPTASCSRSSDLETPFRKSRIQKLTSESKKPMPKSQSKLSSPSIFSIFKKPDTPRRNSNENKIFVSSSKQTPSSNLRPAKNPVYVNKNMTPLRSRNSLALEKKQELYEFEVDESEPKPKKKQRPIMKIQRVRAHKKKKPKVYVPDPEMEKRLLRNLDLSPSILEQIKTVEPIKSKVDDNQPSTSIQRADIPPTASGFHKQTDSSALDRKAPLSDGGIYDVYTDDDHHGDYEMDDPCPSSPCNKYGTSTPLYSAHNKSRDSLLDESIHRFGGLSAKLYSPVKSRPSPIPVLLENYNNDPVRNGDSGRISVVSNRTAISDHSGYQHDLDISASTPVKFHKHHSPSFVSKRLEPTELNVDNCFGFDEPEVMEEPLVSPIKTTLYVPPPATPARPAPIVKKKLLIPPPTQTAPVDVGEVIKKLRSEVGEDSTASTSFANKSVFDDTEIISPKKKSPMKHYLQSKANVPTEKADEDSFVDSEATAAKIPRLSYDGRIKKRVVIAEQPVLDKSAHLEASDCESLYSDDDHDEHAEMPFEIPAHKIVKKGTPKKKEPRKRKDKGMTKKEEEELEKWAKMFNSQCEQVAGFGLCVE